MFVFRKPANAQLPMCASRKLNGDEVVPSYLETTMDDAAHRGESSETSLALSVDNAEKPDERLRPMVGSGLYVDVENLQNSGQELIATTIETWPDWFPKPIRLTLNVPSHSVELWRLWAGDRFDYMDVVVRGTQRFSASTSKNSADMAIATTAMADWILGRVSHVAVLSDDSDFISLYVSMRNELIISRDENRALKVPFLWVVTDRDGTRSPLTTQFLPSQHLHTVSLDNYVQPNEPSNPPVSGHSQPSNEYVEMARAIIREIEVGSFKSTDGQAVIKKHWPYHELSDAPGATFGSDFKNKIWPFLRVWGVRMTNPSSGSVRYEMTESAKQYLKRST